MEMVYFESTPMMSSYLVTIFVGEFESIKNSSMITVYTHKHNQERAAYVRTEASKNLRVLEDYIGIKFVLPKLDLLFIPNYNIMTMPSWGLDMYK